MQTRHKIATYLNLLNVGFNAAKHKQITDEVDDIMYDIFYDSTLSIDAIGESYITISATLLHSMGEFQG